MPHSGITYCYDTCKFQVLVYYGQSPPGPVTAIRPLFTDLGSIFPVRDNCCLLLVGFKVSPELAPTSLPNAQRIEIFVASLSLEEENRQTQVELLPSQVDSHNLESQAKISQHIFSIYLLFSEGTTRVNLARRISQAVFTGEKQYTDSATDKEYYTERTRMNR